MVIKLTIFAAFVALTSAHTFINPMENPDLFHGDVAGEDNIRDRNAVTSKKDRWPEGVVPYRMDSSLLYMKPDILKAMTHISSQTCIKFKEYDGTQDGYIRMFSGEGCYSYWGKTGGQQPVSLGQGCEPFGTIVHELVHAIGFDHEQNRSDRDDYLLIYYQNILDGSEDQFRKLRPKDNWLITPFDYNSIMIYGEFTFSKDRYSKTMVAKKHGVRITGPEKKSGLSPSDIKRINILYECH